MSKKTKSSVKAASEIERLIYCGPNIPGGRLQKYAVFKGGIPKYIEELGNHCPAITGLIVPVKYLAKTEKAIAKKGTPQNVFYQQIMDFIAKGGAK